MEKLVLLNSPGLYVCVCMILYNNSSATIESVNASLLEMQTKEPVHDIGGHAESLIVCG